MLVRTSPRRTTSWHRSSTRGDRMTVSDLLRTRAIDVPHDTARRDDASWRDALVELLVLAEHGDVVAATSLRGWLAADSSVAAASTTIRQVVDAVRAA
jgi:hypothetical protein